MSQIESGIYRLQNTVSGKVYIGSAVDIKKRWREHLCVLRQGKHHNRFLQRSWNKHGPAAFEFKVVLYCEPSTLIHNEQLWIDKYEWEILYNIRPIADSSFGIKHTPEFCAKISASKKGTIPWNKGKKASLEHRAKLTGKKRSTEARAKMSAAKKGGKLTPEHRAAIGAAHKGRKQTPEHIANASAAHKGIKRSPESRARMSAAQKRRKYSHSPETRAKMSAALKGNTLE